MIDTLRELQGKKRTWTLAAWGLLIFAPWLMLAAVSLVIGKNALTTYPVWSDELDYWRSLFCWIQVGFPEGYNGIGEYTPILGTLSVHGLAPILLYGGWCKVFGLTHYSIVLCNAVWISAAALTFCLLVKPKASVAALLAGLFLTFAPAVLYVTTSMTELFNYAFLLFYLAFLIRGMKTGSKWAWAACWLTVIFGSLYRITYFVLFLPLVCLSGGRRLKRTAVLSLLALVLTAAAYAVGAVLTAPYPQGFLYNWMRTEGTGVFIQMFLSHAKANLYDYFLRKIDSPMEVILRYLYCLAMVWTLGGSFFRVQRGEGRRRVKLGLSPDHFMCFLLLFLSFAIVVMFYETNDWSDFRTLVPFLWGAGAWLIVREKRMLPGLLAAGGIATLIWLCLLPPLGAFSDEYRFEAAPAYESVSGACKIIEYDPEAANPYVNSIRSDMATFQVMQEVDPRMGLWFGWFTQENTGKSRWVLTDHLKIVMENYRGIYHEPEVKVYTRLMDYEPQP